LGEQAISHAALADRSQDIGIVIDRNFKLFEANAASMAAFARHEVVSERSGTVRFRISSAQDWLTRLMDNLDRQKTGQSDQLFFASRDDIWRLSVTPLTSVPKMGSSGLFPVRGLYLVLVRKISNHSFSTKNDALAKYLRLTEREWSLCIELLNGHDLNGAAERLNVSKETVRSRLKQIFAKTDTNRQTELLSLLMRA
jgi:DNA-binding CsgD family transcriptional regulator